MIDYTTKKAGRDLDKLVAEAMGWTGLEVSPVSGLLYGKRPEQGLSASTVPVPAYSKHIDAAWEVFETGLMCCGWAAIDAGMEYASSGEVHVQMGVYTLIKGKPAWAICVAFLTAIQTEKQA